MEATNNIYDFASSLERIDDILNADNKQYEENQSIPARSRLTFTNGYYVNCTALFVDICDSSNLPEYQNRPVLAKIYRSFISELVALFNGANKCKEVNINGDCVWAVFDTPYIGDIDSVYSTACKANALVNVLNYKLKKKGYKTYKVGIGIDYGRALMIKAGHKGSTINDVIWMGDVVNQACHLAAKGNTINSNGYPIMLSSDIYNNLNSDHQKLCGWNDYYSCFQSNAVNIAMRDWLEDQKKQDKKNNPWGF
jgi:class 3 adenylate cyclase